MARASAADEHRSRRGCYGVVIDSGQVRDLQGPEPDRGGGDRGRRGLSARRRDRRGRQLPGSREAQQGGRGDRVFRARGRAWLRQQPPPRRADAVPARIARLRAGALVREPHVGAPGRSVSRHALLGVRDGRVGHHHGAAPARLGERAARADPEGSAQCSQGLRRHRHARVLLVLGPRSEPAGLRGRRGFRQAAACRAGRRDRRASEGAGDPARGQFRALREPAWRVPRPRPAAHPAGARQPALVLGPGARDAEGLLRRNTASRCTCISWRPPIRRSMRAAVGT